MPGENPRRQTFEDRCSGKMCLPLASLVSGSAKFRTRTDGERERKNNNKMPCAGAIDAFKWYAMSNGIGSGREREREGSKQIDDQMEMEMAEVMKT